LISFVAVVPLLVSGFALHGQEARGGAALQDAAEWEAPVPAARAKAVELVEAPALSHGLDDFGCQPDELACGRLNFAGKARYFADHTFAPGALVGPLLWSAPILAKPPDHYPNDCVGERAR
jgi:hypothetical protein